MSAVSQSAVPSMLISVAEQVKFSYKNPLPKQAGVLEHCREGKTNCWFFIFLDISF